MNIRNANIEDIDKISILQEQEFKLYYEHHPDRIDKNKRLMDSEYLKKLINSDKWKILIAEENGIFIGHCIFKIEEIKNHYLFLDSVSIEIKDICFVQSYRKQGFGKKLFEEVKKYAIEHKIKHIGIYVWEFNQNAIQFFEHIGMKTTAINMEMKVPKSTDFNPIEQINIRTANVADIDKILVLSELLFKLHEDNLPDIVDKNKRTCYNENLEKLIESGEGKVFIAEENGTIIGYLTTKAQEIKNHYSFFDMTNIYIHDVCINSNYRKQGIGTKLFDEVKKYAIENKINFIENHVWDFNQISKKYFENAGMKTIKRGMGLKIE